MENVELAEITVALAGNANVGKSVIFNQLTGLHQHIGNWPGKTVGKAEGTLSYKGHRIDIVDLPGIYSLTPYSIEEMIARDYIAEDKPDLVIDVVDASAVERNLFLTLQLLELEPRLVIALNLVDVAESKGIRVDPEKLSEQLGVPVVPMVATKNIGFETLMDKAIESIATDQGVTQTIRYGSELEQRIDKIVESLEGARLQYPLRWIAIKLLEGEEKAEEMVKGKSPSVLKLREKLVGELEEIHGQTISDIITSERYAVASRIAVSVTTKAAEGTTISQRLDAATTHPVLGYVIMGGVVLLAFYGIFVLGDSVAGLLGSVFSSSRAAYDEAFSGPAAEFIWLGLVEGIIAGTTIALPYIIPFYIVLSVLEDSGYLARIAFLMDSAMHRIGLHGKGFIPMMLGFGCNVPACLGCRIMETQRERLICAFTASLVPCVARSIVIMGLVANNLGFTWAIGLYAIDFAIIFALGRVAFRLVPGEPLGLIMEMPTYKKPSASVTLKRTWFKLKDFVTTAFPIMIIGNLAIQLANAAGLLNLAQVVLSPVTVWWLGLPAVTGVTLVFGILRKELTLVLLASLLGTSSFATVLSPAQLFVYAFVVMLYVPCIATISVLAKEFGHRAAATISLAEIGFSLALGGILRILLDSIGMH